MKQMNCELCGSNKLQIEDNVVVCKSCGTKYSIEEAKNLIEEFDKNDAAEFDDKEENIKKTEEEDGIEQKADNANKDGKKKYIPIIIVLILVLVAGIYFATTSSNCKFEGCNEKKIENSEYCDLHTCNAEGCYELAEGGEYCNKHTCKFEGCTNFVSDTDYCNDHVCKTDGCTAVIVSGSKFCKMHKCKEDGCNEEGLIDGYCGKHALKNSDLPDNLIEFAQYYGETPEEILKNYTYAGMFDSPGSSLDGCLKYYYKQTQGFYLVETEYPFSIYYAPRENAGVSLVWQNGAEADESF